MGLKRHQADEAREAVMAAMDRLPDLMDRRSVGTRDRGLVLSALGRAG